MDEDEQMMEIFVPDPYYLASSFSHYELFGQQRRMLSAMVIGNPKVLDLLANNRNIPQSFRPTLRFLKAEFKRRCRGVFLLPFHEPVSGMSVEQIKNWLAENPLSNPEDQDLLAIHFEASLLDPNTDRSVPPTQCHTIHHLVRFDFDWRLVRSMSMGLPGCDQPPARSYENGDLKAEAERRHGLFYSHLPAPTPPQQQGQVLYYTMWLEDHPLPEGREDREYMLAVYQHHATIHQQRRDSLPTLQTQQGFYQEQLEVEAHPQIRQYLQDRLNETNDRILIARQSFV